MGSGQGHEMPNVKIFKFQKPTKISVIILDVVARRGIMAWSLGLHCLLRSVNPFKPNGFFHPYYLDEDEPILYFRGVKLIFS